MYRFSETSLEELSTCDNRLVRIAFKAIEIIDFSIIEGARDMARQRELFNEKKSRRLNSYHVVSGQQLKSRAFDILPYPFNYESDWKDRKRFAILAGIFLGIAHEQGTKLTWGGDWDRSYDTLGSGFYDAMHFQVED